MEYEELWTLVEKQVTTQARKRACPSCPLEELVQVGRIGVWESTRSYDQTKAMKHKTWAVECAISHMMHAHRGPSNLHFAPSPITRRGIESGSPVFASEDTLRGAQDPLIEVLGRIAVEDLLKSLGGESIESFRKRAQAAKSIILAKEWRKRKMTGDITKTQKAILVLMRDEALSADELATRLNTSKRAINEHLGQIYSKFKLTGGSNALKAVHRFRTCYS